MLEVVDTLVEVVEVVDRVVLVVLVVDLVVEVVEVVERLALVVLVVDDLVALAVLARLFPNCKLSRFSITDLLTTLTLLHFTGSRSFRFSTSFFHAATVSSFEKASKAMDSLVRFILKILRC